MNYTLKYTDITGKEIPQPVTGEPYTLYVLDDKNQCIQMACSNGFTSFCKYDEQGKHIEYRDSDGLEWQREYNDQGLLIKQTSKVVGCLNFSRTYSENGVLLTETTDKCTLGFIYDDNGVYLGSKVL